MKNRYRASLMIVITLLISRAADPADPRRDRVAESPRVELNHIYLVLDSGTFQQVRDHPNLRELFNIFENTMETSEGTYSHLAWPGLLSYIEIFQAVGKRQDRDGYGAIALSVHRQGDLDSIQRQLEVVFGERVKRETVSGRRPWFDWVGLENASHPPLSRWVMELRQEHLAARGLEPDENGVVSRQAYWEAIRDGEPARSIMRDIVGLSLALEPEEAEELRRFLRACGFQETREEGIWHWTLGQFEIQVREAADPGMRIRRVRMSLTRELDQAIDLEVAGTDLHLATDGTGEWVIE